MLRYLTKYASLLPCRKKSTQMSPVFSGVTEPKFTKLLHNIEASFALLTRTLR